jgi:glycosyltransferase involved in cell wall biosynthesis
MIVRRAAVIPITAHLGVLMRAMGARRLCVEHDGVRLARFADLPAKEAARVSLNLPPDAFVVGYAGRLHTMQMSKGVDLLIDAVAVAAQAGAVIDLLLVGGPDEGIALLREQWIARGLPPERFHATGQVLAAAVPHTLAAMDVGALPLPWTPHFAYYASAIKLFEYMAAGCAVLASDLPSIAEVVRDGDSALLVPPDDVPALAAAVTRLYQDADLRQRLGTRAREVVTHYTWAARAARIRELLEGGACE